MAARTASPGASLLRASRMFAVPQPLPNAPPNVFSGLMIGSDTATQPHPTHLSITTPPTSLSRGDWGLKRPLPLRSTTKTSTPLIRYDKMDTWEHVTEFGSAADHTLTLQKWQELNLPMSTPAVKDAFASGRPRKPGRGVFEEDAIATAEGTVLNEDNRWKFNGPWLAGQTEGEFKTYLQKVRRRKGEFQVYLREAKAIEDTKLVQRKAAEEGQEIPQVINANDITQDEMTHYLRELRQNRSALFRHIRKFLDLPPSPSPKTGLDDYMEGFAALLEENVKGPFGSKPYELDASEQLPTSNSPYAETGPPKTHPSAGLSYLRTKNTIYNHPVFGPQASQPPVEGRIVMPKNAAVGSFAPKIGVAGVVTDVPRGHDSFRTSRNMRGRGPTMPGLINIEPDRVGGSKVYVEPMTAHIDPKGRIVLDVRDAQPSAVAVHEGKVPDPPAPAYRMPRPRPLSRPSRTSDYGYGLGSADNGRSSSVHSRESAQPIDDQSALASLQGLLAESDGSDASKSSSD